MQLTLNATSSWKRLDVDSWFRTDRAFACLCNLLQTMYKQQSVSQDNFDVPTSCPGLWPREREKSKVETIEGVGCARVWFSETLGRTLRASQTQNSFGIP